MIKLVTIDLDGTLLKDNKEIPKLNIDAIKEAKEKGCKIVIATGRPYNGAIKVLKPLGLTTNDDYVILYNGAKVINVGTGEVIYTSTIKGSDCKELYKESIFQGTNIHAFYKNEALITPKFNCYTDIECTINRVDLNIKSFNDINDDDDFLKCMLVSEGQNINRVINNIPSNLKEKYSIVRSSVIYLEFLKKNTDKGEALIALKNYLKLKDDETMAIGDAGNDLGMIKKAHIGVAVKNAFPEILSNADVITPVTNNEAAVAWAINKYVLEKENEEAN